MEVREEIQFVIRKEILIRAFIFLVSKTYVLFTIYIIDVMYVWGYNNNRKNRKYGDIMVEHINKPVFAFESATEVRKEWSLFFDKAVREKPVFIKRTRDNAVLVDLRFMDILLEEYKYVCKKHIEDDGTITLSTEVLDLIENGDTEENAKGKMAASILEYAQEFYEEYDLWSNASNRRNHIPYVFKALLLNDVSKIGDFIVCQDGEN